MKQFIFIILFTLVGGVAAIASPFWGVFLYYAYAFLRPQYMWNWAMPMRVRWSLFAALIAIISTVVNYHKTNIRNIFNPVLGLMICYGLLVMLSILTAFDPIVAESWGIEYAKLLVMAIISTLAINRMWHIRLLLISIMLLLGYIAYEINFLYFTQGRVDIFHIGFGGLDNNGAGMLMAMGIPFAICFTLTRQSGWVKWIRYASPIVGLLMIHAMLMSFSRTAMVAALAGIIWFLWAFRPRVKAITIACLLTVTVLVMSGNEIRQEFLSTQNYQHDESAQARISAWKAAWIMAWESPLLGKGIRNSNIYSYNYGVDRYGRTIHNQYLQIASDSGVPAAIFYMLMLAAALQFIAKSKSISRHKRHMFCNPDSKESADMYDIEMLCIAIQTSMVTFIVGGMFLSMEAVEFPWILLVISGVFPSILRQYIEQSLTMEEPVAEECNPKPVHPVFPKPRRYGGDPVTA